MEKSEMTKLTIQVDAPEDMRTAFHVTVRNSCGEVVQGMFVHAWEKATFFLPEDYYWVCVRSTSLTNPGGQCKSITTKVGCPICITAVFLAEPIAPTQTVTVTLQDAHYPGMIPLTGGITVMAKQNYEIQFVNGVAQNVKLPIGTYTFVSTTIPGYADATADEFTITKDTQTVEIALTAQGELTVRVVDDLGNVIESGTVQLSDATGETTYGEPETIDTQGEATFANVPYDTNGGVSLWVKQTQSDAYHLPIADPEEVAMTQQDQTETIENERAPLDQNVTAVDANYPGIVPLTGNITVNG